MFGISFKFEEIVPFSHLFNNKDPLLVSWEIRFPLALDSYVTELQRLRNLGREIFVTFILVALSVRSQHHDGAHFKLKDHPPKVM